MEESGRREILLRRSSSTSVSAGPPSLGLCHQPSMSADFSSHQEGPCSLTEISDPGACACASSRWSRMRAEIFRKKSLQVGRPPQHETPEEDHEEAADCSRERNKLILSRETFPGSVKAGQIGGWSVGLSKKYEPKVFDEMIGHEMIVTALRSAVQSKRISPLYLFHGPGGTGKTSAAKVFGMALNCESALPSKPCWGCAGCSRSLYTAELCSGNRSSGFENVKTLLRNTAFMQTFPGFKVFIIDECCSLTDDSWQQLLDMLEQEKAYGSLVFIVIVEDLNRVPRDVSSRCQKFGFSKLKDADVILKLARIVAWEGIEIRGDAMKLIAKKVDGDLREAENLLDQLALLGQTITDHMVQQLVGLVPQEKLVQLLEAALGGDSIEAMRSTKDLITNCDNSRGLVLQLASLITEALPGASSSPVAPSLGEASVQGRIQLRNVQPKRLYRALKILIDVEKQLRMSSSNHATWVTAALLQIASDENSNRNSTSILLPKDFHQADDKSGAASRIDSINRARPSNTTDSINTHLSIDQPFGHTDKVNTIIKNMDLEEVWRDILGRIQNNSVENFLQRQTKLISLTVSRANAIIHLMCASTEMSEESISNVLKDALGCPVIVNISHETMQLEVMPIKHGASGGKQVSEAPTHSEQHRTSRRDQKLFVLEGSEPQKSALHSGTNLRLQRRRGDSIPEEIPVLSAEIELSRRDQTHDRTSLARRRSRFLSISSIPRTDVSIEPYSQDLLFEAANTDKQRGSRNSRIYSDALKPSQHSHDTDNLGLSRSWSCTERFCRGEGETMVKENTTGRVTKRSSMQRASSWKDSTNPKLDR